MHVGNLQQGGDVAGCEHAMTWRLATGGGASGN